VEEERERRYTWDSGRRGRKVERGKRKGKEGGRRMGRGKGGSERGRDWKGEGRVGESTVNFISPPPRPQMYNFSNTYKSR